MITQHSLSRLSLAHAAIAARRPAADNRHASAVARGFGGRGMPFLDETLQDDAAQ
jgi:hypothetical protein